MKKLLLLLLLVGCWPDNPPIIEYDDAGNVIIEDAGTDSGTYIDDDAGISDEDAGVSDEADAGIEDAGVCKNGWGWGDNNHCHHHKE